MAHRRAQLRRLSGLGTLAVAAAVAALTVGAVPAMADPSGPQTRYVAVDGADINGDLTQNDCLDQGHPCLHIGWAGSISSDGDTIQLGAGTFTETVPVPMSLTIAGEGASKTTIKGPQGTAILAGQILGDATSHVTIKDLTITSEPGNVTGAVQNFGASMTIENTTFSGNAAAALAILPVLGPIPGAAPGSTTITGSTFHNNGSGILQGSGALRITDSTFTDNTPAAETGPIAAPVGFGIGMLSGASLSIERSSISGSDIGVVSAPVVLPTDGGSAPLPTVSITDSTVSGNKLSGIASASATTTIDNTTVTGNSFSGILSETGSLAGPDIAGGTVTVKNSTVSDTKFVAEDTSTTGPTGPTGPGGVIGTPPVAQSNIAEFSAEDIPTDVPSFQSRSAKKSASGSWLGQLLPDLSKVKAPDFAAPTTKPGSDATVAPAAFTPADARMAVLPMADAADAADSSITISGTIVDSTDPQVVNCSDAVQDAGYNLASAADSSNSCGLSVAQHDLLSTDPHLGALAENGGATETQLPAAGSPAIDAIPVGEAGCTDGATDQRGTARPQGDACDIGAVEAAAAVVTDPPTTEPATDPATSDPATTTSPAETTAPSEATTTAAAPGGSTATQAGALPRTGASLGPAVPVGVGVLLLGALLVAATAFNRRRNAAKH